LSLPARLTPQQTLNILRAALGGDLWQQWMLLSLMLDTWPTFRMAQHQLREAVAYTKFMFEPHLEEEGAEATDSAVAKARLAARAFRSMSPDPFSDEKGGSGTVYDFTDAALNGISMSELIWNEGLEEGPDGMARLPRASAWTHPRHYTFTQGGKLAVFREHYSYHAQSFMQLSGTKPGLLPEAPDPRKFICSQFVSRSGSSLGAGFMRPLAYFWSIRQFGWEWMAQASKKHGMPFIDITYRPGASDATERARIKKFCQEAGPDRFLIHPEGSVATIHPAQSLGPDNPTRFTIEQADRECLFLLLGQAGTTMATPGKLGQEGTHADVKDERVQGLADWAARNPMRQFARAVLTMNFGDDRECPTVQADFTKPLDSAQVAQLASAITVSRMAFQRDEVYKKLNMTPPQPGDLVVEGGQTVIMEEPVTRSEMQELQMKAAVYDQLAAQQGQYQEQEQVEAHYVQAAKKLAGTAGRGSPRTLAGLKALLAGCGKDDLDGLERLVLRAQKAEPGNGEWRAVEVKINQLSNDRLNDRMMT
jgi:phage gp29-like protein